MLLQDPITTKRGSFIALVMVITWLDFGDVLLETVILANVPDSDRGDFRRRRAVDICSYILFLFKHIRFIQYIYICPSREVMQWILLNK